MVKFSGTLVKNDKSNQHGNNQLPLRYVSCIPFHVEMSTANQCGDTGHAGLRCFWPKAQDFSDPSVDPMKDTVLRYLGYANEFGESFRPIIKWQYVWASWVAASGYALSDMYHKKWLHEQLGAPMQQVSIDRAGACAKG